MRWDIFCRVVDNFGDAGVAWRLARQLRAEWGAEVRLVLDQVSVLARLDHRVEPEAVLQEVGGITVVAWGHPLGAAADVVVETFGCEVPDPYLSAMAGRSPVPVWVNLEYLSAEPWVEGCHRLPSPHSRHGLSRHFFFPGFTRRTGGLLRETGLLAARDAFRQSEAARERFCSTLALPSPAADARFVTLFGYDTVQVHDLLEVWTRASRPVYCVVPEGTPLAARVACHLGRDPLGRLHEAGALTLAWIPFRDQMGYDELLWSADCNFVRGEDSFVRAQWAARPLVWHIYPQSENAHRIKLDAFLAHYLDGLAPELAARYRALFLAWNGVGDMGVAWNGLEKDWPLLETHARAWADRLAAMPDLAHNLVEFVEKSL